MNSNYKYKNYTECTCKYEDFNNDCIDEKNINFTGICDPDKFEINNTLWKEFTFSGSISVPSQKPPIKEIDSVSASVDVISQKTIITPVGSSGPIINAEGLRTTGKKLIIEGFICFNISYVSSTTKNSINTFHGEIPFSTYIVLPEEASLDNNYLINSCIENICANKACDKTINLTITLLLNAISTFSPCYPSSIVNSEIDCKSKTSCNKKNCNNITAIKGVCSTEEILDILADDSILWTELSVPEIITIPDKSPNISEVLSILSHVDIICQQIIETPTTSPNYANLELSGYKLLIHAILKQRITYTSTENCNSVHSTNNFIPISLYIVLPNEEVDFTNKYKIRVCIEDIFACALNNRQLFKNTTLFFKAEEITYTDV